MAYNAEYAIRIAKVQISTRKKPDCMYITIGPRAHVDKKYNAVEISVLPAKVSFRFFVTDKKKFGPKSDTSHSKKARITHINSSTSRIAIYDKKFIKKLEGFEGEYRDATTKPAWNFTSSEYICWINLVNKESYTNMYKNTSTEYSHKKPESEIPKADILAEEIKKDLRPITNPIKENPKTDISVETPTPNLMEATTGFTDKIKANLNRMFGVPKEEIAKLEEKSTITDSREKVKLLFGSLCVVAHKSTDNIQSAMADIFNYQLRNTHVTYEEANRNIKLQQILLKYIKLQDEIEEIAGYDDYKPKEGDGNVQS